MNWRIAAFLSALTAMLAASGCAGPKVAGSEVGGAIPMAGITREQASEMARAHCAKYGHSSRILSVHADAGDKAVFECI